MTDKKFKEVAHQVMENRYSSSHASGVDQRSGNKQRVVKAKELPDAGFTYTKNRNVEKVTKPDPPLKLPQGVKYNIVLGCLQEYPIDRRRHHQ